MGRATMAQASAGVRRARYQPPVAPPDLVRRPRLIARLDRGASLPLTLVHAPGGFGKTTLLAAWANGTAHPCAWVSLGPEDDDPLALASALCAAIDRVLPGRLSGVAPLLRSADPDPAALGSALAAALGGLAEPLSLVIDDGKALSTPQALAVVAALLAEPVAGLNVVLSGRSVPKIPGVPALRRRGLVEEIGERDLKFTAEEAEAMLGGAAASPAALRRAVKATGGWPAGLRALLLRGADGAADGVPAAGEAHAHEVMDRVLAGESDTALHLLTATAMLDQVSAPLADALLDTDEPGGSQAVLEDLLARQVFVSRATGDRAWFRVHHLLRDELLERLRADEGEEGLRARNLRASAWFEEQGDIDRAVRHALAAVAVDRAAGLVERHALSVVERSPWQNVGLLLRRLPRDVVHARPGLLALLANLLSEEGRIAEAEAALAELEALLAASPELEDPAIRAEIEGVRAYDLLVTGDPRRTLPHVERGLANPAAPEHVVANLTNAMAFAAQADGRVDEGIAALERLIDWDDRRPGIGAAIAGASLALILARAERLAEAARTARLMAASIEESSHYAPETGAAVAGTLAYLRGDVDLALGYLRPAAAASTWVFSRTEAAMTLALALEADCRRAEARAVAARLVADSARFGRTPWSVVAESFRARLAGMTGDLESVHGWLAANERTAFPVPVSLVEDPRLTRAWLRLLRGAPADQAAAVREASRVAAEARAVHDRWTEGRALAVLALAMEAGRDREGALDALGQALAGDRATLHRRFVDLGPGMLDLLQAIRQRGDERTADAARAILAAGGRVDPPAVATRVRRTARFGKKLSPREREVLAMLGEGVRNEEIGARLGIAIETVKQHASAIYEKYGIRSRRQAGEIARRIAAGETVEPGM